MTPNQFDQQMTKLEARWKGAYTDSVKKLIWKEVSDFQSHWFEKTVDEYLGSSRQAPLLPEFREAIAKQKEKEWALKKHEKNEKSWNENYQCATCKDTGVFLCSNKNMNQSGPWAFRCHCSVGMSDPRTAIPHYKQFHVDQGFVYEDVQRRV